MASIISQYVSAALILQALLRCKDIYALHPGKLRLDPELTKDILKLGMPSGLQNVIFQFANSFVQMGVNSFDATMVAGNSAATNADAMYTMSWQHSILPAAALWDRITVRARRKGCGTVTSSAWHIPSASV